RIPHPDAGHGAGCVRDQDGNDLPNRPSGCSAVSAADTVDARCAKRRGDRLGSLGRRDWQTLLGLTDSSVERPAVRCVRRQRCATPYLARMARTLSSGIASTVWPLLVTVVAMNIES